MKEPMPLGDLPGYIRSVRDSGQGGDSPVVDMGRIVAPAPRWGRRIAYAGVACVLVAVGGAYAMNMTEEISIRADLGAVAVASAVSAEGGRVISVRRDDDGSYRVRVLSFGMGSLVERLRGRKDFKIVEAED